MPSLTIVPITTDDQDLILYQSDRTLVFRRKLGNGSQFICKKPLGTTAAERLRHEKRILERLVGIKGVQQISTQFLGNDLIVLEDENTTALFDSKQEPILLPTLLGLALQLAQIIAAMHRAGVVHKDINPNNILLYSRDRSPLLTDFDLATTFIEERPGFVHAHEIAGNLAYLAPELTGRTGRAVDQRVDLYALGAVLYELAVGYPPFVCKDPLQLIHNILARTPVALSKLDATLPPAFSAIVARLLEKEPDRRYQSAEGLAHDLARVCEQHTQGKNGKVIFTLGERDFPLRLLPPSRLVGREGEIAAIQSALNQAVQDGRSALVTGAPGIGKSALINELRSMVTAQHGWYINGKYDQHRYDAKTDEAAQALRALIRLLLAEPEAQLTLHRERICVELGTNLALFASILPEFTWLVDVTPEIVTGDPVQTGQRILRATLGFLRSVTSPTQPLVIAVDDLQWAPFASIGFIDALVCAENIPGLLFVGSYRENEIDATHPLSAILQRWEKLNNAPLMLRLNNLQSEDLASLLSEILRLPQKDAARLAEAIGVRTQGNPFDTMELVNSLRRDGVLSLSEGGWQWDKATIQRFIGQGEVIDLLTERIGRLPSDARMVLVTMACIGGELTLNLLAIASGISIDTLEQQLAPALEDGLLVMAHGSESNLDSSVRFRHDRVQQAAYQRVEKAARNCLHLLVASRLEVMPEFEIISAEQYALAFDALNTVDERRRAIRMFHIASMQALSASGYSTAERFLAKALALLQLEQSSEHAILDNSLLKTLEIARHRALYSLGRLDEADEMYALIANHCSDPVELADAASSQILSLTNRARMQEALSLGLDLMERLGLPVPSEEELGNAIERAINALSQWIEESSLTYDFTRSELNDPRVISIAKLLYKLQTPAYVCNRMIYAWQALQCHRLFVEYGPGADLMSGLSTAPMLFIAMRQDYRSAYEAARKVIAIGNARNYKAATCYTRFVFAYSQQHWFEPLENGIAEAQFAREGLLHDGNLLIVCFTYYVTIAAQFDCSPTLNTCENEIEQGMSFAVRTGNEYSVADMLPHRQLLRALCANNDALGSFDDADFNEAVHLDNVKDSPSVTVLFHIIRALSAAIFGDGPTLVAHATAAMPLLQSIPGFYVVSQAYLLQSLALTDRIKSAAANDRATLLNEIDNCVSWLTARATEAPANFLHLQYWIEAERAWATNDALHAIKAFDIALRTARRQSRPWHNALICERAGLYHLEQDLEFAGRSLLSEARYFYEAWGATAKVQQMSNRHDFLYQIPVPAMHHRDSKQGQYHDITVTTTESIDLMGILRASQTLSSETSLAKLRLRMTELLQELSGATHLTGAAWYKDLQQWRMVGSGVTEDSLRVMLIDEAAQEGYLPLSVFRYIERTRQPLLVADVTSDDRFANDPYFTNIDRCSLLGMPVFSQDVPSLILILENRLSHSVFSSDSLQTMQLIAGQLAVSIDNAMLYESLEQKVTERTEALEERTEELEKANRQLASLSVTDALTGLPNRRRFNEMIEIEWVRAIRPQMPIAVAMIDIDQFKLYNDHYGHQGGDECLRRVAKALGDTIRGDGDLVARYGGEEFVIVLPGTNLDTAQVVAERARAAVEILHEPHAKATSGIVTISVGIASVVPTAQGNTKQLIELADAALYRAKKNGRNQVV